MPRRERITIAPSLVRFTQDSVAMCFQNGQELNMTCEEIVKGVFSVDDFPHVRVIIIDGEYYSVDNRRLYVFRVLRKLGVISTIVVCKFDSFNREITTENEGCHVRVRSQRDNNEKWKRVTIYSHCPCTNRAFKTDIPDWWDKNKNCHRSLANIPPKPSSRYEIPIFHDDNPRSSQNFRSIKMQSGDNDSIQNKTLILSQPKKHKKGSVEDARGNAVPSRKQDSETGIMVKGQQKSAKVHNSPKVRRTYENFCFDNLVDDMPANTRQPTLTCPDNQNLPTRRLSNANFANSKSHLPTPTIQTKLRGNLVRAPVKSNPYFKDVATGLNSPSSTPKSQIRSMSRVHSVRSSIKSNPSIYSISGSIHCANNVSLPAPSQTPVDTIVPKSSFRAPVKSNPYFKDVATGLNSPSSTPKSQIRSMSRVHSVRSSIKSNPSIYSISGSIHCANNVSLPAPSQTPVDTIVPKSSFRAPVKSNPYFKDVATGLNSPSSTPKSQIRSMSRVHSVRSSIKSNPSIYSISGSIHCANNVSLPAPSQTPVDTIVPKSSSFLQRLRRLCCCCCGSE